MNYKLFKSNHKKINEKGDDNDNDDDDDVT